MKPTPIERSRLNRARHIFSYWCHSWNNKRVHFTCYDGLTGWLKWESTREDPVWLNYPLVNIDKVDSIARNWDETWPGFGTLPPSGFIPTEDECMQLGMCPLAIMDIVMTNKGNPLYFINICINDEATSPDQKTMLEHNGVNQLFDIDADWILQQGYKTPGTIVFKKKVV